MIKTNGADYKAFVHADWDALFGVTNAYMDDVEVLVNGVDEPADIDTIPDDAKVEIYTGYISADTEMDLSLIAGFKRWKKTLTQTTFVVSVPNSELEYFKAQLKICKGRVL